MSAGKGACTSAGATPKLPLMALPAAMRRLDASTFDALVCQAERMAQHVALAPGRTLTPARILVLAVLSLSSSRKAIRDTAWALRTSSRFHQRIRRVHVHSRLCVILRDLHDMGLVHARRGRNGSRQYMLEAGVQRSMQRFLQEATYRDACTS